MRLDEFIFIFHPSNQIQDEINSSRISEITPSHLIEAQPNAPVIATTMASWLRHVARPLVLAVLRHWLPASRQMPLGGEVHSRCASPAMACLPKFLCSLDAPVSCCWLSPLLSSIFLCRHRSLENWSNVDIR
jgi:hypothetical protein